MIDWKWLSQRFNNKFQSIKFAKKCWKSDRTSSLKTLKNKPVNDQKRRNMKDLYLSLLNSILKN